MRCAWLALSLLLLENSSCFVHSVFKVDKRWFTIQRPSAGSRAARSVDSRQEEFRIRDDESLMIELEEDDDEEVEDFDTKMYNGLVKGTDDMLNMSKVPLGSLTMEDVEIIANIMATWTKRKSKEAALTVEKLLKRVVDDMRAGNTSVHVTTRMYTMTMDAWSKSGEEGVCHRVQNIHDGLIELYKNVGDPEIEPSVVSYNTLINAWSKSNEPNGPEMAEKALAELIETWKEGNESLQPDNFSFATVIDSYGRNPASNSIERAEALFDMMDELGVEKNAYAYSGLQMVYARSKDPASWEKAETLLFDMMEKYELEGNLNLKPNAVNFNAVLHAYSRTDEGARKGFEMLKKMEQDVDEGGYDVEPDKLTYVMVMATSGNIHSHAKAASYVETVLERMEARAHVERQKQKEISRLAPPVVELDIGNFNVALAALSKSGVKDAGKRSMAIIDRMNKYADEGLENLRPNTRSWTVMINAAAKDPEKGSARRAEELMNQMFEMYHQGNKKVLPDRYTFSAVLTAYLRSPDKDAVQRADNLVRRMEKMYDEKEIDFPPDVYHYTILCSTWARSGRKMAASRCAQILSHMHQRYQAGFSSAKPNTRTYNAVIECLSRQGLVEKAEQLLYYMLNLYKQGDLYAAPDVSSFKNIIFAWCKSNNRDSGERAEALLERLLEYKEENTSVRLVTGAFAPLINHYAHSKAWDAPYKADYILNRMISLFKDGNTGLVPTNKHFCEVIDSYAFRRTPDAGQAADRLLKLMNQLKKEYDARGISLTSNVMNSVMHAWSISKHPEAAPRLDDLLLQMEAVAGKDMPHMAPNTRSYMQVLSAWRTSNSNDKVQRALQVLRRMEAQRENGNPFVRLNEHAYSLVINNCAFSRGAIEEQRLAFETAVSLLDQMLASDKTKPSGRTYGWFIQACRRLEIPPKTARMNIERAFSLCCEHGLVNDFVLTRLHEATSETQFQKLLAPGKGDVETVAIGRHKVHPDWTRNNRKAERAEPWWEMN